MPTDRNTQHWDLNTEDWEVALEPYAGFPSSALSLGFNLMVLKAYIVIKPPKIQQAVAAIDRGAEVLFNHTQFHEIAYILFRRLAEGKLTLAEEETLKSLGLKF